MKRKLLDNRRKNQAKKRKLSKTKLSRILTPIAKASIDALMFGTGFFVTHLDKEYDKAFKDTGETVHIPLPRTINI